MMHFNTNIESEKKMSRINYRCIAQNQTAENKCLNIGNMNFLGTFLKHINGCQPIVFTVHPTSAINRQEAVYIILIEYYRM